MRLFREAFSILALAAALIPSPVQAGIPAAAKMENPWKRVPVGTILEFRIVTEEGTSLNKETRRAESTETWTVVGNDGRTAVIDIAAGGTIKRIQKDLAPVDPWPEPPAGSLNLAGSTVLESGAADGRERLTSVRERIETPLGVFEALRIDLRTVRLESESRASEWRVPGYPEPIKTLSVHAGGAGVTPHHQRNAPSGPFYRPSVLGGRNADRGHGGLLRRGGPSRDLERFPPGTNFDVQVEKEHTVLFPAGRTPTIEKSLEHWTLLKKDDKTATFEVAVGASKSEKSLPLALDPPPVNGQETRGLEEHRTASLSRETITTLLGILDCLKIRRTMSMNEADGQESNGAPTAILWPSGRSRSGAINSRRTSRRGRSSASSG